MFSAGVATEHYVNRRIGLVAEIFANTAPNRNQKGIAAILLFGGTYALRPSLVFDTGIAVGLTHIAPNVNLTFGASITL